MLNSVNLDDKSYEELRKEALAKIPLYSSEWTNFNKSDPGITTLEALTSFNLMQQGAVNTVTPAVCLKLLKLAGYEPEPAECARVLIGAADKNTKIQLPTNQKIFAGETCFETNQEIVFQGEKVLGIYMGDIDSGSATDITYLLKPELPLGCEIYTDKPNPGMFVDILFHDNQTEKELIFYVSAEERVKRNPFHAGQQISFAQIAWQIWTGDGFQEIEENEIYDETYGFLISGEIRIRIPDTMAKDTKRYSQEGYLLRALLVNAEYDIPPKIKSVESNLFEVHQKHSLAVIYIVDGSQKIELYGGLQDSGYQTVYCMEQQGKIGEYYKYSETNRETDEVQMERGRCYKRNAAGDNRYCYEFNKEGIYRPVLCKDAIRIVCYEEEALKQRYIGKVYGYDNQVLDLSIKNIYDGDFMVIAEYDGKDGNKVYDFFRPGMTGDEELNFVLAAQNEKILITNPGKYEGADLYIANLSVFAGKDGNVRNGNEFLVQNHPNIKFYNPADGSGGRKKESIEELRGRFARDMSAPDCIVTEEDYSRIIMNTPGLAIHKVKAVKDRKTNHVTVAVKPHSISLMPKLSEIYQRQIMKYIEDKRLITTRVTLCSPVYVPIDVHTVIYVKKYAADCKKRVIDLIRENLDYISDYHNFGAQISFSSLFKKIEAVEGVEYVYNLSTKARQSRNVKMFGYDIVLNDNCLCYAGNITVDINTDTI